MATLISRIFRTTTSESEPTNRTMDVKPELSLLNETADDSAEQLESATSETSGSSAEELSRSWTMEQVLNAYPSAQRALFQRYHVGGCSSCGFQPIDTLEAVCVSHGLDVDEVITVIEASRDVERQLEVSPEVVVEQLERGEIKLLDVRTREEYEVARIGGATLLDEPLAREIIERWPKNTPIVTVCHHGIRSLDVAAYIKGHGFPNVKSMKGGIDAWSIQVDPKVARY